MDSMKNEFSRLVPVDDCDCHADTDGNDVDHLEFLSSEFDDMIVRGKRTGKYYFHDETLANLIGPYDTEADCRAAETKYFAEIVTAKREI